MDDFITHIQLLAQPTQEWFAENKSVQISNSIEIEELPGAPQYLHMKIDCTHYKEDPDSPTTQGRTIMSPFLEGYTQSHDGHRRQLVIVFDRKYLLSVFRKLLQDQDPPTVPGDILKELRGIQQGIRKLNRR